MNVLNSGMIQNTQNAEIAAVREIVQRHDVPDFVTGFEVVLGEYDDEPIVTVTFNTSGHRPGRVEDRKLRASALSALRHQVHQDLRDHFPQRYPYFDFTTVEGVVPAAE